MLNLLRNCQAVSKVAETFYTFPLVDYEGSNLSPSEGTRGPPRASTTDILKGRTKSSRAQRTLAVGPRAELEGASIISNLA